MARKRKSQTTKMSRLQRYLFSGAAVGLYFGLFFTPVREPNFTQPFLLGAAAAVIAGAVIWVRSKLSLKAGLFNLGRMFVSFTLFLLALELRHPIYADGGRPATAAFMLAVGLALGWPLSYAQQANLFGGSSG